MITYEKCPCCDQNDITVILKTSFFKTNILQCNNCFFKFNDLSDKPKNFISDFYKQSYWDGSLRKQNWIRQLGRKILSKCRARSHYLYLPKNIVSVLEIGAGLGISTNYFSKHDLIITVVEPDKSNVSKIKSKNKSVNTISNIFDDVDIEETFDLVYASHVFEHVVDINHFLNKVKSNTKNNGFIFLEVPNCTTLELTKRSCMEPHLSYFTRKSLELLVEKLDLKIISLDAYCFDLPKKLFPDSVKLFFSYAMKHEIFNKCEDDKYEDSLGLVFRIILKT
jgi:2-polyprenyl-3-methyl-5-hydroxy-6-metoxy-1,4-benzoquinol methylase